jgi:exopolysaccharide biosynthesis polyprenyl glycosylphosphotransferase
MRARRNSERDSGQACLIVDAADSPVVDSDICRWAREQASIGRERPAGHIATGFALLFGDVLVLVISGLILWRLVPDEMDPSYAKTSWMAAIAAYVLLSAVSAAYRADPARAPIFPGKDAAMVWLASTALTVALHYTTGLLGDGSIVRFAMLCLPAGAVSLVMLRALTRRVTRMLGEGSRVAMRVAVVGRGPILGVISSAAALAQARGNVASVAVIELTAGDDPFADLIPRLQAIMPDVLVLAAEKDDLPLLRAGARAARALPLELLVPAATLLPGIETTLRFGDQPLVSLKSRPLGGVRGLAKRAEDLCIGLAALPVAMPVMLLAAILIRLDSPGPILIRQRRFGYGNRPIFIWKFRTMYWEQCDLSGAQATIDNDPRVTRLGRFLRSTSLDELPQLFNVLSGDMSLVGPRPHPVEMRVGDVYYHDAVPDYLARHRMKPGITGLAQINGSRGLVDTIEKAQRRLDYDLQYIDNWSISLDLVILLRTAYKGFRSGGSF